MHTILIQTDTLAYDKQKVRNLRELLPECNIQLISRRSEETHPIKIPHNLKDILERIAGIIS